MILADFSGTVRSARLWPKSQNALASDKQPRRRLLHQHDGCHDHQADEFRLNAPVNPEAARKRKAVAVAPTEVLAGADAENLLRRMQQDLNQIRRRVRLQIQSQLQAFTGQSLPTIQQNQELAAAIHALLDGHGLRVRCAQCGHPAILRVSSRKSMPCGAFVFDHTIDGRRTFHGGTSVVPELKLTAKPSRRRSAG